jgi:hypothetical protein
MGVDGDKIFPSERKESRRLVKGGASVKFRITPELFR